MRDATALLLLAIGGEASVMELPVRHVARAYRYNNMVVGAKRPPLYCNYVPSEPPARSSFKVNSIYTGPDDETDFTLYTGPEDKDPPWNPKLIDTLDKVTDPGEIPFAALEKKNPHERLSWEEASWWEAKALQWE